MPIYVYGLKADSGAAGCAYCRGTFELLQKMSAPPLGVCPKGGAPVEKLLQPPFVGNVRWLKGPSAKDLARAGFTQYKREGKGRYEKSFGQGPATLTP